MMQAIVGPLLCLIAFTAPACNRDVYDNLFDPVNQYTVTFDSQGGTAVSAQTVDYGSTISQPADPVLTGYTFAGWFTEPGCATPWLFGSGTVQGDATLYARWTINQYTVSFDPQGGSAIAMQTVNHNGYAADPGAPARTGYTFGGWFREAGCVTQWFFPTDTITENRTLFAQWTINTYTLTYTAGANGSLTGTTTQFVTHGSNGTAVTAVPNVGYHFTSWSDGVLSATRTDTGVTGDITVTANFAINQYTLSYSAGPNGSLSGATAQVVNHGASGTAVTAVPNVGYHFVNWNDGSTANPRTDTNVTGTITVSANFAINQYTLTYTAGVNGSLSGTSPQTVNHGGSGTAVTATPNIGYHFTSWSDGVLSATRTDINVTGAITVTANFAINQYTLSYSAGPNGSLSGATAQVVNHGASGTAVTAVPNVGYHFTSWSDGPTDNPRTDTAVTGTITVSANFAINQYTLTYTAGANGSLSGTSPQTVNHGGSGTAVTAVPNVGYHFTSWSDGVLTATRTDINVTGAITVTASFAINTYTLTYNAGAGGSITGSSPQTVNHGANGTAVTATPNVGYYFTSWSDGGLIATRTDTNITGDLMVTASFSNEYTVTYDGNGSTGGAVPAGPTGHNYNSTVTVLGNSGGLVRTGYIFVGWNVNPGATGASYVIGNTFTMGASNVTLYAQWAKSPIAFESGRDGNTEIYIMSQDGTCQTNVSNNAASDSGPVWSPDGSKIAFVSQRDGNQEIYVVNIDGSGLTNLSQSSASDFHPAWSPDGSQIAFVSDRDGNAEIYVMNASDGSGMLRLTSNTASDYSPAWSPDSNWIAYASTRSGNQIYKIQRNGTGDTLLATHAQWIDGDVRWSPDGQYIALRAYPLSGIYMEIYRIPAGGGSLTNLSNNSNTEREFEWSPDSARIAFIRQFGTNYDILIMNADGSSQNFLVGNGAFSGPEDRSPSWSPNGSYIVYSTNGQIYKIKSDYSGGMVQLTTLGGAWPRWAHTFANGDIGPGGGYIFYDKGFYSTDGNGTWRYLEAAPVDQSALMSMLWWNGSFTTTGATGTAIGTGKTNTNAIISSQGAGTYAATACTTYSNNGYNDWFLPSRDELIAIRNNLYVFGIGGLNWQDYVSSSEINSTTVYYIYFDNGNTYTVGKNFPKTVRAIRAF